MSEHDPEERLTDAESLRKAFHALVRSFGLLDTARTPCGQPVAVSHAHALMELQRHPGATQNELAAALGLSKSAVSRMAAGLERRGWLERRQDSDDGRVRRLTLTARGGDLARKIDDASLGHFEAMLGGIPPHRRAVTLETLQLLRGAIPSQVEDDDDRRQAPTARST